MAQTTITAQQVAKLDKTLKRRKELPIWIGVWGRILREKPLAAAGLIIVALFLFIGIFANFIAPEGLNEPHLERLELIIGGGNEGSVSVNFIGPSWEHPMGLDNLGRDLLSRVIYGARISVIVGFGTVLLGTTMATIVGMTSAWIGGKFDTALQRIVDAAMVFPWLVFLLIVVTTLPNSPPFPLPGEDVATWGMVKVIIALSILDIAWVSRMIRSAAMAVKENQYVEAARAMGASGWRINFHYILPNIMAVIITVATLNLGYAILSEAFLSYLGHGVPPPNPSWGGMLTRQGGDYLFRAPWIAFFPGLMISLVIFGINVLGDGLRDLLDPRLKGSSGNFGETS